MTTPATIFTGEELTRRLEQSAASSGRLRTPLELASTKMLDGALCPTLRRALARRAPNVTEFDAQVILHDWSHRRGHLLCVPNVYLFHGESDFVTITRAGLAIEIEIKLTLADFKNELGYLGERAAAHSDDKWLKHAIMAGKPVPFQRFSMNGPKDEADRARRIPAQYFIAAPVGVIPEGMIPAHAGLIEFRPHSYDPKQHVAEITKRAPRLHAEKLTPAKWEQVARSLHFRYWRERLRRSHTQAGIVEPEANEVLTEAETG